MRNMPQPTRSLVASLFDLDSGAIGRPDAGAPNHQRKRTPPLTMTNDGHAELV